MLRPSYHARSGRARTRRPRRPRRPAGSGRRAEGRHRPASPHRAPRSAVGRPGGHHPRSEGRRLGRAVPRPPSRLRTVDRRGPRLLRSCFGVGRRGRREALQPPHHPAAGLVGRAQLPHDGRGVGVVPPVVDEGIEVRQHRLRGPEPPQGRGHRTRHEGGHVVAVRRASGSGRPSSASRSGSTGPSPISLVSTGDASPASVDPRPASAATPAGRHARKPSPAGDLPRPGLTTRPGATRAKGKGRRPAGCAGRRRPPRPRPRARGLRRRLTKVSSSRCASQKLRISATSPDGIATGSTISSPESAWSRDSQGEAVTIVGADAAPAVAPRCRATNTHGARADRPSR